MIPWLLRRHRPNGPGWWCHKRGHVLETSHLVLRSPQLDDQDAIREVMDEEFVYWNGYPEDDERLDVMAKAWIHKVRRKPYRESWVICDRASGDILGLRTVMSDAADSRVCATGGSFAAMARGKGLGKEELATFLGLMRHLGFQHVIAASRIDNYRAISLYTKLGFERVPEASAQTKSVMMSLQLPAHHRPCRLR